MLTDLGAFSQPHWVSRGSWSYASNQYINDTGCGNIHLAGCVVEVFGNSSAYTIKVTTPTTSPSGVTNGDFIYVNNGSNYHPGWRRLYSTAYKPTASEIGAAPTSHNHTSLTGVTNIAFAAAASDSASMGIAVSSDKTYFDFNLSDDVNADMWRWRFGAWNSSTSSTETFNAMTLTPTSTTAAKLTVSGTVQASTFSGALSGNATTATKLQTARTIALGGILSGSASFDGSGNVIINATANDTTTITKSLNVTTSWADTGITGSNLGTGTYAVQMYVNDGTNTSQYQEYYSGMMSWFNGTTNSTDADEILLHKAGHASNGRHVYLRTIRTPNSGNLKLQISCTHAFSAASNITFKFKKLI